MRATAPTSPTKPGLNSPILLSLLVLSMLLAMGCAPDRSVDDDDDDGGLGTRLSNALFTVVDSGEFASNLSGRLVLVDEALDCSDLSWGGALQWWALDPSVDWVEAYLVLGVELATWDREFQSYHAWSQEQEKTGTWDYTNADYFSGNIGIGGYGDDDGDVKDPPPIGREIEHALGNDEDGASDRLVITSYSEEGPVSGYIQGDAGNYNFEAEHCGVYQDGPVDGIGGGDSTTPDGR